MAETKKTAEKKAVKEFTHAERLEIAAQRGEMTHAKMRAIEIAKRKEIENGGNK